MERYLEPEDRRQRFYEALTDYARALQVALASVNFYEETPEARIKTYKARPQVLPSPASIGQATLCRSGGLSRL